MQTNSDYSLINTVLFRYNKNEFNKTIVEDIKQLIPIQDSNFIQWFDTCGYIDDEFLKEVILQNNLDDFLIKLLT